VKSERQRAAVFSGEPKATACFFDESTAGQERLWHTSEIPRLGRRGDLAQNDTLKYSEAAKFQMHGE
jgi:hypothetical protein